ncbi:MAG TPA: fibronectin type III domain-containing protein [Jatrophihabitantaceae bacterium]
MTAARRAGTVVLTVAAMLVGFAVAVTPARAASGHDPRAATDPLRMHSGVARVSGWAIDPDSPTSAVWVRLRIDGGHSTYVRAASWRAGLAQAHPVAGANHGWRAAVIVPEGKHKLCAVVIDIGPGHSRLLRCWSVRAHYRTPGAPTHVRVSTTWNTATVRWRAPADKGGGVLQAFRIQATDSSGHVLRARVAGTARIGTVTGLRPLHHYTIRVRAFNAAHRSAAVTRKALTKKPPIPPQTTPAPVARSHYLRQLNGVAAHDEPIMRAMGAADAAANVNGHRYLVLLHVGGQTRGGTLLSATITYLTYAQLVDALKAYLTGYASRQHSNAPALIAVSTNNDGTVSRAQGVIWAQQVVKPLVAWSRHYRHPQVAGSNDIEPGFRAGPSATRAWLSGYLAGGGDRFVYGGSADGCPTVRGHYTCNNGWTIYDLHWLAGGASPSRIIALPQIYNTAMPWQWQVIGSVYGQRLNFRGALTERRACAQAGTCFSMTNTNAWRMLYAALRSSPVTSVYALPYGPDLRIN